LSWWRIFFLPAAFILFISAVTLSKTGVSAVFTDSSDRPGAGFVSWAAAGAAVAVAEAVAVADAAAGVTEGIIPSIAALSVLAVFVTLP